MGYTTEFHGAFVCTPALPAKLRIRLALFSRTRHCARKCDEKYGPEGRLFAGTDPDASDVIDYNRPADGCPSLWCQWVPSRDGTEIRWDGSEKFYHYVEWLQFLIDHFLKPNDIRLDGLVKWEGEDWTDRGIIYIQDDKACTENYGGW